jgi:hypothetical protein
MWGLSRRVLLFFVVVACIKYPITIVCITYLLIEVNCDTFSTIQYWKVRAN